MRGWCYGCRCDWRSVHWCRWRCHLRAGGERLTKEARIQEPLALVQEVAQCVLCLLLSIEEDPMADCRLLLERLHRADAILDEL